MGMREKIVELLEKTFEKQYDKNLVITAYSTANYLLAHDVVPVVRCKDCKNRPCNRVCKIFKRQMDDDCYCSYGERKDGKI